MGMNGQEELGVEREEVKLRRRQAFGSGEPLDPHLSATSFGPGPGFDHL